jgi:hypothetical protein
VRQPRGLHERGAGGGRLRRLHPRRRDPGGDQPSAQAAR